MLSYHFILTRTTVIKKMGNNKYWKVCGEIRILIHCLGVGGCAV